MSDEEEIDDTPNGCIVHVFYDGEQHSHIVDHLRLGNDVVQENVARAHSRKRRYQGQSEPEIIQESGGPTADTWRPQRPPPMVSFMAGKNCTTLADDPAHDNAKVVPFQQRRPILAGLVGKTWQNSWIPDVSMFTVQITECSRQCYNLTATSREENKDGNASKHYMRADDVVYRT